MEKIKEVAYQKIDEVSSRICQVSDQIWDTPETAFQEFKSTETLITALEEFGFEVTRDLAGISTAFSGRFGQGSPVIGLLGEFDALSGMSQQVDVDQKQPLVPGGAGHGCGHNLLGAGSLAAAVAVRDYLIQSGAPGTVIYYGCPGEEGGSGKAFMARDGVFDELDCAITWHPGDVNGSGTGSSLANIQAKFKFRGISSHAAACPELGRSALDGAELMNMGVQFLREHVIPEARIHYAFTDSGGFSPNVVQPTAELVYLVRAPETPQVMEIFERVCRVAQGAGTMTDTNVEIQVLKACSNLVPNKVLYTMLQKNLEAVPALEITQEETAYAKKFQDSFESATNSLESYLSKMPTDVAKAIREKSDGIINSVVMPLSPIESTMAGSTDVGDVSWVCPTAQISTSTCASGTPGHSWQLVAQGKSSLAHKAMLYAAKAMAGTVIELMNSPEAVKSAKEELDERRGHKPFVSPIPAGLQPAIISQDK